MKGAVRAQEEKYRNSKSTIVRMIFSVKTWHIQISLWGETLADSLGLRLGDKVTLFTPQATMTPIGIVPRFKHFDPGWHLQSRGQFWFRDTGDGFYQYARCADALN